MSISLNTCILILKEHHLLKSSAVQDTVATKMDYVSYDSRDIQTNTLFFCKGAGFRPTYLSMAKDNGAICYVAEQPYPEGKGMHALIVRDVSKAMALLSAAFCSASRNRSMPSISFWVRHRSMHSFSCSTDESSSSTASSGFCRA